MTSTLYRGYELTDGQFARIHICIPADGYVTATADSIGQARATIDAWHADWREALASPLSLLPGVWSEYRAACFHAIRACGEFE